MVETRIEVAGTTPGGADRSAWGWFVFLGSILLALGLFALTHVAMATAASIFMVGVLMVIGGISHMALAFRGETWKRFLLLILGGVLYLSAGVLAFMNPLLASAVLTIVIAFALLATGAARIAFGIMARKDRGWGWFVLAGLITLVLGLIIATGWPVNSLWIIGMFLGVDLLLQGWAYLAFGLSLRAQRSQRQAGENSA